MYTLMIHIGVFAFAPTRMKVKGVHFAMRSGRKSQRSFVPIRNANT